MSVESALLFGQDDVSADGLSIRERRTRFERFLARRSRPELIEIALDLMEQAFCLAELADCNRETSDTFHQIAIDMGNMGSSEIKRLKDTFAEQRKAIGAKGGNAAAAVTREIKEYAAALAQERQPLGGWPSAPVATGEIYAAVCEYARVRGRSYSVRKVEEWLREAGIKRPLVRDSG